MKGAMSTTVGKIIQTEDVEDGKKVAVKPDIRKKGGNQVGDRMTCKGTQSKRKNGALPDLGSVK